MPVSLHAINSRKERKIILAGQHSANSKESSALPVVRRCFGVVAQFPHGHRRSMSCYLTRQIPLETKPTRWLRAIASTAKVFRMEVHIGRSGWFYRHWRGIFYPDTERTDRWFSHYVHEFKTVELNSPFHKWSKLGTINSWKRTGRPGFCCSVKLSDLSSPSYFTTMLSRTLNT